MSDKVLNSSQATLAFRITCKGSNPIKINDILLERSIAEKSLYTSKNKIIDLSIRRNEKNSNWIRILYLFKT